MAIVRHPRRREEAVSELSSDDLSLRGATVQQIQLELIRRSSFNAFDGPEVVAALSRHRKLWRAAWMTRTGVPNFDQPRSLLIAGMIPLRDLPDNIWNVDKLFLLCPTLDDCERIVALAEDEGWAGEPTIHRDEKELSYTLGSDPKREGYIVSFWWD